MHIGVAFPITDGEITHLGVEGVMTSNTDLESIRKGAFSTRHCLEVRNKTTKTTCQPVCRPEFNTGVSRINVRFCYQLIQLSRSELRLMGRVVLSVSKFLRTHTKPLSALQIAHQNGVFSLRLAYRCSAVYSSL